MDDPEFICSTEYEKLIEIINTTSVINMILQILRIPVSKEFRAYRCGTKPSKPFITLLVDQSKKNKEKEKLAEPISDANTQMPVSAGLPATEASESSEEAPAAVVEEKPEEAVADEEPQEKTEEVASETPAETAETAETRAEEVASETPAETAETPAEEAKVAEKPTLHAPTGSAQEKLAEADKPAEAEKPTLHAPTGSAQPTKGGRRQTKKRRVRAYRSF